MSGDVIIPSLPAARSVGVVRVVENVATGYYVNEEDDAAFKPEMRAASCPTLNHPALSR